MGTSTPVIPLITSPIIPDSAPFIRPVSESIFASFVESTCCTISVINAAPAAAGPPALTPLIPPLTPLFNKSNIFLPAPPATPPAAPPATPPVNKSAKRSKIPGPPASPPPPLPPPDRALH